MRAVQITRFGGPEVMDIVDLPDPVPGPGQKLYEVSSAGVNFADTHHRLSWDPLQVDHEIQARRKQDRCSVP
jgi:NADPH:quinone reductase-like Zn-dependent oxidoreductase